jgi:hypothetical protein
MRRLDNYTLYSALKMGIAKWHHIYGGQDKLYKSRNNLREDSLSKTCRIIVPVSKMSWIFHAVKRYLSKC